MKNLFCYFLLAGALGTGGCGGAEPTGPKQNLSDAEKQQVKELNQQRQDEWGKGRGKNPR